MKIKKKDVVNLTGGVETEDGRTLYGFDAENYLKMKSKEDPEYERKVGEWIEDVIGDKIDTSNLWQSLKTGLILIKLANTIKPGIIPKFNNKSQNLHPLMERENINLYLEACWKLGVSSNEMFISSDLQYRRGMAAVLANITALSREATKFGNVNVAPIGPSGKKKTNNPPKFEVNISGPVYSGELESDDDDVEEQLSKAKRELEAAKSTISKLESSNSTLREDIDKLRDEIRSNKSGSNTQPVQTNNTQPVQTNNNQLTTEINDLKRNNTLLNSEINDIKRFLAEREQELKNEKKSIRRKQKTIR